MIATMTRASLRRNRLVSAFLAGFLVLATALLSSATILAFAVFGTVEGFMESARTPHFMQMHLGAVDEDRLERFAADTPAVESYELIEILNVENSAISFDGRSLDAEIQQNAFTTQPRTMDLLLSQDGQVVRPEPGQIWVPTFYADKYQLAPGDTVTVSTPDGPLTLDVAGAFRDSQMNSTLASSKRLLVDESDYQRLTQLPGSYPEYLISFRGHDSGDAKTLEAAYNAAGLEADGPALTWDLFTLVNSINDAVTVLLFTMMAFIILLISFLCIRYTLLTTLEEDLREIGVMKALGVGTGHIRRIYLGKYRWLLASGAVLGFVIALLMRDAVLSNVRRQLGTVSHPVLGLVAGFAGAVLLYLIAMGYTRRVLTRLGRISALSALRGVSGLTPEKLRPKPSLSPAVGAAVTRRLAFAHLRRDPSRHLTILAVAFLVTLVLLVPIRFAGTATSQDFVSYMGMGSYDLRIDLLNRDDAPAVAEQIRGALAGDQRVHRLEAYTLETESVLTADGEAQPMRVDYGDPDAFPLRYGDGHAPQRATEIGLSELNAERFGVTTGDTLTLRNAGGDVRFTVSGVYQDVTNGGKTAKALPGPTMDAASPGVMIAISTTDPGAVSAAISDTRPDVAVVDTRLYVQQMLGDLIRVLDAIAWVFAVVALVIGALIAGISIRLMLVQERKATAVLGALGFTTRQLRGQYLFRVMSMMVAGVLLGVVLAGPLGNTLGSLVFGSVGLSGISLRFSPLATVLGSGLVLLGAWVVTALHTRPGFNAGLAARLRS